MIRKVWSKILITSRRISRVGDDEGVVLRAERRLELAARPLAVDAGLEIDDDGVDGVVVERADVQRAVHDDDAAVVRVVAIDAGDREARGAVDGRSGRRRRRFLSNFSAKLSETTTPFCAIASRSASAGRARRDHRQVAESRGDVEVAAADGDDGVAVDDVRVRGAVEGGDEWDSFAGRREIAFGNSGDVARSTGLSTDAARGRS